ncbi:Bug family tripartite tricarboxylate transporter substrate binding protein [Falsiroseomonas sp.]|uniref:Bug family tripartite tricarboxylate transporter substrate binding protein n=1 Tax=Falsiroseomonas sp. TaxID=2870721 RepID=UPI003F6F1663
MNPFLSRRLLLGAALAAPSLARAQAFPAARPLRLVVPFGPGGITDLVARVVAERAAALLGVPVVVENRAGANGNIAGDFVAKAAPDGHTLLMASVAMFSVNPVIYAAMPYDPARDFEPVIAIGSTPHLLVAHPAVAPDLAGLVAAARARPEALSFGTAGAGSSPHLTQLAFQQATGARLLEVHFRSGSASVQSVLGGQVSMTAEATPIVIAHVQAGTLRAYAVASPSRVALMPDVPTTAEAGLPGLENGSTSGIVAPRGTPAPILARLNEVFDTALRAEETRARLVQQGTLPLGGTGDEFRALVAREVTRWRPLLAGVSAG